MKYIPIIIPCAGKGSRAGLESPKSLFVYNGQTIFGSIIEKCATACDELGLKPIFYVVVRESSKEFVEILNSVEKEVEFTFVLQPVSTGTADAVNRSVLEILKQPLPISASLLLWGDCIGFSVKTLKSIIVEVGNHDVVVPGFYSDDCYTVFRVKRKNIITSCEETKDREGKVSGYTDIGVFSFKHKLLQPFLEDEVISASDSGRESSFIQALSLASGKLDCFLLDGISPSEKKGFNSFEDLNESYLS